MGAFTRPSKVPATQGPVTEKGNWVLALLLLTKMLSAIDTLQQRKKLVLFKAVFFFILTRPHGQFTHA